MCYTGRHSDRYDGTILPSTPYWPVRRSSQQKSCSVLCCAARVVSNTRKFDSGLSQLLHDEFHWLDVTVRVQFKFVVLVMYRCLHGTAPLHIMEGCTQTADVVSRRQSAVRQTAEDCTDCVIDWTVMVVGVLLLCPVNLEFAARQSL